VSIARILARPGVALGVAVLIAVAGVSVFFGVAHLAHGLVWLDLAALVLVASSLTMLGIVRIRSTLLRRQTDTVARQTAILDAVTFASERFILDDDLDGVVAEVMARLGEASGVSRVYVYENGRDDAGRPTMSIRYEWVADLVARTIHDPENVGYPYEQGFSHWERELSAGRPMQVGLDEADDIERRDMQSEGVRTYVVVPVFAAGRWWGFMGLDDCERQRAWSETELDALKVAAAAFGAAVTKDQVVREAAQADERYRTLVEQLPAAVYIDGLDDSATTLYISPRIEEMLGYPVDDWEHTPELWPRLLHPDDRERTLAAQAQHNETGLPFREEYRLIAKDGREVWIRDEAVMICDDGGRALYSQGVMYDITESKEAEAKIAFLAYRDQLTGLPNQAMFQEVAEMALARARRTHRSVAALALDVDRFKLANDSLGPETGDALLRSIADRLDTVIRDTDMLARRSGDEFVILLADLERGEVGEMSASLLFAESVAERIQETMAEPFLVDGGAEVYLSISVGISVFPDDADDARDLLQHAETALLQSKQAGPGGFAAATAGAVDAVTKLAFVTKLRKAVELQEWELHYQPIVELATGAAVGVEALVRWRTPEGEMVPPNEFIPLAEELGLIEAIGDWVVEELVRQDEAWRAEGLALEMGFNLSPRQFWQPDLAERILTRLALRSVDPTTVTVEVTESSAMRDPERASAVLWDLHARGLRVAIDDFGTGYSSLSRLRNLPIDVLKIDRTFVSEVDRDPQAASIVAAFIQLGQGLGMTTLAEGIETEAEWRFLAERGCELGQGFFFSRPVPADEIAARHRAGDLVVVERG
jgi:diguanylate cyclase (GGDEF)-like protein/PAS domain S-box-containing protein